MFFDKILTMLCGACQHQVLYDGLTDVIVLRTADGKLKSTPFYVCFGTQTTTELQQGVKIEVNGTVLPSFTFSLDENGYVYPNTLQSSVLESFNLREGKNLISYHLGQIATQSAEIYLYNVTDRIVVSDFDGTLTKSDVLGWLNNIQKSDFLQPGYTDLIKQIQSSGYRVVWLTMRSLPFYKMTKEYVKMYVGVEGPLLTQPENAVQAFKKEVITHKADIIKCTLCKNIKDLYPNNVNPFAGGLGNKQTDSIAYAINGIPLESIYRVDPSGVVQRVSETNQFYTYNQMADNIQKHFPRIGKPKIKLYVN